MGELLTRVWENLIGRLHGPLTFRLILQPLTAAVIATRAGIKDARSGHPAYGWAVLAQSASRKELLREVEPLKRRDDGERRNPLAPRDANLRLRGAHRFVELAHRRAP